jgi:hypothetical protein
MVCVAGSLLGWAASMLWPTPFRATRELYVGLNVYRAINDLSVTEYAGIKLVNANDYKNWQMSSLNSMIFMDEVIEETLSRLQQQDPYWKGVKPDVFASSLHVYWRNAGKWRLVAEHKDPERAVEAVTAWQQVVVDRVHRAVIDSQEAMLLEFRLRSLADSKAQAALEAEHIRGIQELLEGRQADFSVRPARSPVTSDEHWQIWVQAVSIQAGSSWESITNAFPSDGAPLQEYVKWLERSIPVLDLEIETLERQQQELDEQERLTAGEFSQASTKSLGLSATLDVDKIADSRIQLMVTRPTGILMLAGGLLGLIACLAVWISGVSLRGRA